MNTTLEESTGQLISMLFYKIFLKTSPFSYLILWCYESNTFRMTWFMVWLRFIIRRMNSLQMYLYFHNPKSYSPIKSSNWIELNLLYTRRSFEKLSVWEGTGKPGGNQTKPNISASKSHLGSTKSAPGVTVVAVKGTLRGCHFYFIIFANSIHLSTLSTLDQKIDLFFLKIWMGGKVRILNLKKYR